MAENPASCLKRPELYGNSGVFHYACSLTEFQVELNRFAVGKAELPLDP